MGKTTVPVDQLLSLGQNCCPCGPAVVIGDKLLSLRTNYDPLLLRELDNDLKAMFYKLIMLSYLSSYASSASCNYVKQILESCENTRNISL